MRRVLLLGAVGLELGHLAVLKFVVIGQNGAEDLAVLGLALFELDLGGWG